MTTYEQTRELLHQLSLAEKINLLEELSASLRQDLALEAYQNIPWEQFVNLTYGSLADDPLERGEQPLPDMRDEIE